MRKSISISLVVLLSACFDQSAQLEREFLEKYLNGLYAFPDDITDHFPGELKAHKNFYIHYPASARETGMAGMVFSHQVDSTEFNRVRDKLVLNNIIPHKTSDSIFIIVGDTLGYSKKKNGIPIPNFNFYEADFGLNSKYLPEHYLIYVLESKAGEYLKDKYLTEGKHLPKKWKNGYSRGLATNKEDNELVYWLCVW
ncbi:hypothetical protein [Croceimicrobium sp.]|uniref:hypothetical protein n=1 Tax=Croceimicrobium sp. TaxID=2828340 RepID=UPI003BAC968C